MRSSIQNEKKACGIPEGLVLYSDLNAPAKPLFSRRHGLVGKPDYIVQKQGRYIPVEVKSGKKSQPQQSHILQLAAYCQILEDASGAFVPEGILVYNTTPHLIQFTPDLRFELETQIDAMREALYTGIVTRNHQDPARCTRCSYRRYCDEPMR